eukprot:jgi/Ulvmu1/1840/UM119_0059.1
MTEGASNCKVVGVKNDTTVNQPWIEKYRPQTLDEVAANKEIVCTIKRLTDENRLPHLLLYGPPGTGKTSTVLAIARQLYGKNMQKMTLELNASDDRGISVVRQEIQDFASTKSVFSSTFKLIVLDECDAMTKDAQFALRRVIEKYARNARFCLICNYVNKIIPALQSRCTRFRFPPLPEQFVKTRLEEICQAERVQSDDNGLEAVCHLGKGDMRQTLNILQSVVLAHGHVSQEFAYLCTGNPPPETIEAIFGVLLQQDIKSAFYNLQNLQRELGFALVDILRELHPFLFSMELPAPILRDLTAKLADIELNLSVGTNAKLQTAAVVGAFTTARLAMVKAG